MSQNLEAVQRVYRAWGSGDTRGAPEVLDPFFVYFSQEGDPDRGPHYGLEASKDYYRRFLAAWDSWRIEAIAYREVGDSVLVRTRRTGTGKSSRVPVDDESFHVWTLRGAKAIRLDVFSDEVDALEAMGLLD